jgi:hypothetical protein
VTKRCATLLAVLALCVPLVLAGCTTKVVEETPDSAVSDVDGRLLPRPQRVLVADFVVAPQAVEHDQGIGPRIARAVDGGATTNTARQVQDAVAESLIAGIRKMGFAVSRSAAGAPLAPGDLLIQGEILKIDEGNRTRRLVVGFGAGQSRVDADVQVYYRSGQRSAQLIRSYDAESNSGYKPGLGVGAASAASGGSLAPGLVSGALGVRGEKQGVAGEGQRLGDRVAYNLGEFFVKQQWIPPSAAPSRGLR